MNKVFYFTDIHGHYDLFHHIITWCKEQDANCQIIFGGDACDRGVSGYRIMKELLEDPQVIYLKGNHEDMFDAAASFIMKNYHGNIDEEEIFDYLHSGIYRHESMESVNDCVYNGGLPTLTDWMMDGLNAEFVKKIHELPITHVYNNIDFCHSGGNPDAFTVVREAELEGTLIRYKYHYDIDDCIWQRMFLDTGWTANRVSMFGHTPTPHIPMNRRCVPEDFINAAPKCYHASTIYDPEDEKLTGARIAMDVGTIACGRAYVIDCDTFVAYGFYDAKWEDIDNIGKHVIVPLEPIDFSSKLKYNEEKE